MPKSEPSCKRFTVLPIFIFIVSFVRIFNLAESAFFCFATAGAVLVLVGRRLRLSAVITVSALAVGLAAAYRVSGGRFGSFPGAQLENALAFLGLAASVVLAWRAVREEDALNDFLAASILPIFAAITVIALRFSVTLQLPVYDSHLYAIDSRFGVEGSTVVARWFDALPMLRATCGTAYQALPLMQVAALTICLRRDGKFPVFPVLVFGLAGLEAPILYRILPAVGPLHLFGPQFAQHAHDISVIASVVPIDATPPNSMPSLHFAWALLILWNVPRESRVALVGATIFVGMITLATLGLGEHYLVDLVVAVPFAVAVQNTCAGRWMSAATAGAIVLAWFGYLRFSAPYPEPRPAALWTAALATVALPFFCTVWRGEKVANRFASSEELAYSGPSL